MPYFLNVRTKTSKGIIKGYKRKDKNGCWLFEEENLDQYIKSEHNNISQEV